MRKFDGYIYVEQGNKKRKVIFDNWCRMNNMERENFFVQIDIKQVALKLGFSRKDMAIMNDLIREC